MREQEEVRLRKKAIEERELKCPFCAKEFKWPVNTREHLQFCTPAKVKAKKSKKRSRYTSGHLKATTAMLKKRDSRNKERSLEAASRINFESMDQKVYEIGKASNAEVRFCVPRVHLPAIKAKIDALSKSEKNKKVAKGRKADGYRIDNSGVLMLRKSHNYGVGPIITKNAIAHLSPEELQKLPPGYSSMRLVVDHRGLAKTNFHGDYSRYIIPQRVNAKFQDTDGYSQYPLVSFDKARKSWVTTRGSKVTGYYETEKKAWIAAQTQLNSDHAGNECARTVIDMYPDGVKVDTLEPKVLKFKTFMEVVRLMRPSLFY